MLSTSIASGAAGDADPSFGGAGYVRYSAPKVVPGLVSTMLGLDDGSVIVAGGAFTDVFLKRYRADGSLDETFGSNGTTLVPGLIGGGENATFLHLFRDPAGRIFIEQDGTVRRLSANGAYDATYLPARIDVIGRFRGYDFLPLPDGRFVVVSGLQGVPTRPPISVRFFLADGKSDKSRGGESGERLIYPEPEGTYNEASLSAAIDANGKILIAARRDRPTDISLVLIRLNGDGSIDTSFGQNGAVTIGSQLGNVSGPQLAVGSDGRIAYLFSPPPQQDVDPYFVVYVSTSSGQQDASAPSGGRIAVVIPKAEGPNFQWRLMSGPPALAVIGVASSIASRPTPTLMLWRADLTTSTVGTPIFTSNGFGPTTLAANRLWVASSEDPYTYGNLGASPLTGFGRGVLVGLDSNALTTAPALRIPLTLEVRENESFDGVKALSDGRLVVLGSHIPARKQYIAPTLTWFTADGRLDTTVGNGTGRIEFAGPDASTNRLLRTPDDSIVVLRTVSFASFGSCSYAASLWRFKPSGIADTSFGANGGATVVTTTCSPDIAPGIVDTQGKVTLLRTDGSQPASIYPIRHASNGSIDTGFQAIRQSVPMQSVGRSRLDALPDGRLQAIVVAAGNQQLNYYVLRWKADGALDAAAPLTSFVIPAVDGDSSAVDMDTVALTDGRTLIAVDELSQRIVLRLRADGTLDPTFGAGGTARIDGLTDFNRARSRLAVSADGRIHLAYNTRVGTSGYALTIARFTRDGQRDLSFTADGRFDSVFSLNGYETGADIIALPDGAILAVGQSAAGFASFASRGSISPGGRGIVLRLRGTSQPAFTGAPIVEFFNGQLGHYFITGGVGEIVGIDKGGAGPGWERTGLGFRAFAPETGIPTGATPVCRFYGTPGRGPNSHFYTANATECAAVKRDPGWTYEGIAFYATRPVSDRCPSSSAVYRAYNNGFARNDSNHRYSTNLAALQSVMSQGWVIEGVAFCEAGIQ